MRLALQVISGVILLMVVAATAGWYLVPQLRKNEDYPKWAAKWICTMLTILGIVALCGYLKGKIDAEAPDYGAAFFGGIGMLVLGLVMAIIWRGDIAAFIARPFGAIYDGGNQKLDEHPLYSIAEARRKRGRYTDAIAEVQKQLEKFPNDFDGQYLIAEIQAENVNDLRAAEQTIDDICAQPHPPASLSFALHSLADWHLKFGRDPAAARRDLQRIIDRWPASELSLRAAQRIAHLTNTEFLLSRGNPRTLQMPPGVADVGLIAKEQQPHAPEDDPAKQASAYVQHLQEHPLDTEARERLAVLYVQHYDRIDLAAAELEQLITQPGQPPRRIVHWLNLLADLKVEHGDTYESVRGTVQRIIDLFPGSAAAQTALNRLDHLKLELKGKAKGQTVRLGSYKQDIGLQ